MKPSPTATSSFERAGLSVLVADNLSALGNSMVFLGLLVWTYSYHESAAFLSIMLLAQLLPPFLLHPLALVVTARWPGLPLPTLAHLLRAALLVPLLPTLSKADLPLVLAVALLAAIPLAFAIAPCDEASGVSPMGITMSDPNAVRAGAFVPWILGAAAITFLFPSYGLSGAVAAGIAGSVVAALILFASRCSKAPSQGRVAEPRGVTSPWRVLAATCENSAKRTHAGLRWMFALCTGGLVVAQIAFVGWGLYRPVENAGLILAAQAAGALAGTLLLHHVVPNFTRSATSTKGLAIMVSAVFAFGISTDLNVSIALAFLIGFGAGLTTLEVGPLVSDVRPSESSASSHPVATVRDGAILLSVVATGALLDAITPRLGIVIISILLAILALYSFGVLEDEAEALPMDTDRPFDSLPPALPA